MYLELLLEFAPPLNSLHQVSIERRRLEHLLQQGESIPRILALEQTLIDTPKLPWL